MKKIIATIVKIFIFTAFVVNPLNASIDYCPLDEKSYGGGCWIVNSDNYRIAGIGMGVIIHTLEFVLYEDQTGNIYLKGNYYDPIFNWEPWHLDCLNDKSLTKTYGTENQLSEQLHNLNLIQIGHYTIPSRRQNKETIQKIFQGKTFTAIFAVKYYDNDIGGTIMRSSFIVVRNEEVISEN
jgi:hypothetical protein